MKTIQGAPLTKRQNEVLKLMSQGETVDSAARLLGTKPSTVRTHKSAIAVKLGARSTAHAVALGLKTGII